MSLHIPSSEPTLLVHINFGHSSYQEELEEFQELAAAAGAVLVGLITATRKAPEAKYFIGTGKAEEIRQAVSASKAQLVLFNHTLTPAQERNLERLFGCRVLDRIGLILDIFAQRARTFEGKLQVELAQLQHMSTRLVRGWTHLERQKGGIGLRGPGETQLESDRRAIRDRIKILTTRLEKVRSQREQGRRARQKAALTTISLVGYTNAGKSTLFNCLTKADVFTANQLFATLDPTLRRVDIPNFGDAILVDTVGFIRHLPHELVESFRATLEETQESDLLVHVIDVHDQERDNHTLEVNKVLQQIGADTLPQIEVFNKVDLIGQPPHTETDEEGRINKVWISAEKGLGLDLLTQAIGQWLGGPTVCRDVCLPASQSRLRATLYDLGAVQKEQVDEQGNYELSLKLPASEYVRLFTGKK